MIGSECYKKNPESVVHCVNHSISLKSLPMTSNFCEHICFPLFDVIQFSFNVFWRSPVIGANQDCSTIIIIAKCKQTSCGGFVQRRKHHITIGSTSFFCFLYKNKSQRLIATQQNNRVIICVINALVNVCYWNCCFSCCSCIKIHMEFFRYLRQVIKKSFMELRECANACARDHHPACEQMGNNIFFTFTFFSLITAITH